MSKNIIVFLREADLWNEQGFWRLSVCDFSSFTIFLNRNIMWDKVTKVILNEQK